MMRFYGVFLLALGLSQAAHSTGPQENYKHLNSLRDLEKVVYSSAVQPQWINDSDAFWYKNQEKTGTYYYLVDAKTGKKTQAKTKEELDQLIAPYAKVEDKAFKKDHQRPKDNKILSPDSLWTAYIKDHNVYIASTDKKDPKEIALSLDGTFEDPYDSKLIWSPNSKKLATLKTRKTNVRRIPLLESSPKEQVQPILQWRNYAKPGDVLPVSLPVLFDIDKMEQIVLDSDLYKNQFNLWLTGWRADSRAFTFEFNQRGHQRYIVGEVDATNGAIRHLVDEVSPTFISYINNYRHDLNDGSEMLWVSERDGWRHLYLIDGKTATVKKQLTKGEFVIRKVDYVDEENQKVYFMASGFNKGEDPYNLHYCSVNFDGSGFKDLTPENGNHKVYFSKDRQYFVDVYSRPDLPPVSQLKLTKNTKTITTLEKCDISELEATGWQMPEVFSAKGRDGKTDIWGTIFRPKNFDPTKTYPIIENIYAGPHDSHVKKDFQVISWYMSSLAELGFIVVNIDGMGTNNRSKKFHDVAWKNLKDAGFPDRIKWIQAAAKKYKYMDTSRVGIFGWSAGGQNAMAALLFHNDFYKSAVSYCGCHDNRMDKVWWNELWMGYPIDESYSKSSNVDNAHLLEGNLLLINGELDDNVDPASTLQVVHALIQADKYFEQIYMPGKGHSLGGAYELGLLYEFFTRTLQ